MVNKEVGPGGGKGSKKIKKKKKARAPSQQFRGILRYSKQNKLVRMKSIPKATKQKRQEGPCTKEKMGRKRPKKQRNAMGKRQKNSTVGFPKGRGATRSAKNERQGTNDRKKKKTRARGNHRTLVKSPGRGPKKKNLEREVGARRKNG